MRRRERAASRSGPRLAPHTRPRPRHHWSGSSLRPLRCTPRALVLTTDGVGVRERGLGDKVLLGLRELLSVSVSARPEPTL